MNPEGIRTVPDVAEARIVETQKRGVAIKKLRARIYDGEPMMQKKALFQFADVMSTLAQSYQCPLEYTMTSNMTLLDDDLLNLMKEYHILRYAQSFQYAV